MRFEQELISACVNNPEILEKALRSGIDSSFFDKPFEKYIFKCIEELYDLDNVGLSAIEKIIANGELVDSEKTVYIKTARKYCQTDFSDINLTFDRILAEKKKKDLFATLQNAAWLFKNGQDVDTVIEQISSQIGSINKNTFDYQTHEYWLEFDERQKKRVQVKASGFDNVKFGGDFACFERYFPLGLPPGTITAIGGPTFVGKSVFLSNMVTMACSPINKMDTIFVVAENSADQTNSRLDAIYLDKPYLDIFESSSVSKQDSDFFQDAPTNGFGRLWTVKVNSNGFDVDTLRSIVHDARSQGMNPTVLVIDSPDHQVSKIKGRSFWEGKKDVYWENKHLAETEELILICSAPMKASSTKNSSPSNEDIAGAYDIARIVDFMIMFNVDPEDKILGRAKLVVTKNREYGIIDKEDLAFRFRDSLRLIPFEDSLKLEKLESGKKYKIKRPNNE